MNERVEPPDDGVERMVEAVDRLTFLVELLAEHYNLCPLCMATAAAALMEVTYGHCPVESKHQ